jgi:hypothetical protein
VARSRLAEVALIAGIAATRSAFAAEALARQEERIVNFAYATRLGSGIYDVDGRTVQVYRLPFGWTPRQEALGRPGFRVRLPVTIGFIDFKPIDIDKTGLPDDLDTLSFVPGLEVRLLLGDRWRLTPWVEAGVAKDRASDTGAYVSSVAIRSLADFVPGRFRLALGNELLYTRVDPDGDEPDGDLTSFETCFEARHDLGFSIFGEEAEYGLYAASYLSWNDPRYPIDEADPLEVDDQYEVGVTFGTREPLRAWGIRLPRLGVGYRFAEEVSVWRFVIGIPAPSLER